MTKEVLDPADERQAAEIVRGADARGALDIVGGDTKRGFGRPREGARSLSTRKLSGIVFHEPAEMTLRARAGTPLSEVEASLAAHNQILPFEPMNPGALWGEAGEPTVGGLVATALSGPRRISAGAVRDSLIGVKFINGAGEILNSGGRVTKNVTGLDLVKIQCGAQGTLGLLLEATFKLLPRPETEATLVMRRLDDARGVAAMSRALGSPFSVSGAATIHAGMGREFARTFVRIEGFEDSVSYRAERLVGLMKEFDAGHVLRGADSAKLWRAIRDVEFLAAPAERAIWRISVQPSLGAELLARLGSTALASLLDWGGGLAWVATDPSEDDANLVRTATRALGGHATLMRADPAMRARVDVFEPPAALLMKQTIKLKASLDPRRVFNTGRMYAGI